MRFFFYGTLMDRDVLVRALGRPVLSAALERAVLHGWRRTAIKGASYPIVVRDKSSSVEGITLDGVSRPESERLSAYEGADYRLVQAFADFPARGPRAVFVFVPRPGAFRPLDEDWSLTAWQSTHKERFLARLMGAMRDGASAADQP